jgi:hypothetical protein
MGRVEWIAQVHTIGAHTGFRSVMISWKSHFGHGGHHFTHGEIGHQTTQRNASLTAWTLLTTPEPPTKVFLAERVSTRCDHRIRLRFLVVNQPKARFPSPSPAYQRFHQNRVFNTFKYAFEHTCALRSQQICFVGLDSLKLACHLRCSLFLLRIGILYPYGLES